MTDLQIDTAASVSLRDWAEDRVANGDFGAIARRLGALPVGSGTVEFGIWAPVVRQGLAERIELEVFVPPPDLDVTLASQTVAMERHRFEMVVTGETAWLALAGVPVGGRDSVGALYRFRGLNRDGAVAIRHLPDPMGMSFPFGAFAPAEVVDLSGDRADAAYFEQHASRGEVRRQGPPTNILQVHPRTATEEGTLAALARRIESASQRVAAGDDVDASDLLWMDYDSIELLPIEPLIDYEGDEAFWIEQDPDSSTTDVALGRPDMIDWGYDIPICGSAAVTATVLETGRPHELIDFISTLHTLPTGPIRVIFDVVYGHADNQAKGLMQDAWFTGPDMYGQHLDYLNPFVRAQLLEMQRRKGDFGADGLRVDGAQDFTWWDHDRNELVRDDAYMQEMSDVVQEVAGVAYRPWMIFEDGRPWPRDDWELASTYRAVTELQPHVFQWGPLTFAHNTPFLFTFWVAKWWRLREIAELGSHWISGCANHDTLRRGSQVHPEERINTYLGDSLPEVIERAYDHPAASMLFHGFLPGVPMDFLQGIARVPWSFIRTTDRRYALKVWGEEARFLDWRVTEEDWADAEHFTRLKALGFETRSDIVEFMSVLEGAVLAHGDSIEPVVDVIRTVPRPLSLDRDVDTLVMAARAWMSDVHDFCSLTTRRLSELDAAMVRFGRDIRAFRKAHPWLLEDLTEEDVFEYRHPTRGAVLFFGLRTSPDSETEVLFVANMEGEPTTVTPIELLGCDGDGWEPAVSAPRLSGAVDAASPLTLPDATGAIFTRRR